ncbi:MAG TPA: rhodanese-like domain-containing protein, partial [Flavobacteriales bacterium]|nr:rhodanese-like domain-containing protein [Flavobacteriales bacterium]
GYKNVFNLYGGIFDWKNKGFRVVDNQGKETEKVHPYNEKWGVWLTKGEKAYE